MPRRIRLSARTRLTAIYASLFAGAGVLLVILNYSLLSAGLPVPEEGADPAGDRLIAAEGEPLPANAQAVRIAVNESLTAYRAGVLEELVYKSALALVISLMLAVLLGWVIAGRALRPLREMTATVRRSTDGDLRLRLPVPAPRDEIRELAETFNDMLDRVEQAFDHERRVVAHLSHEIRTPLANQRAVIEVTLSEPEPTVEDLTATLRIVASENRRSQLVSERILHLAQAQGTDGSHDEPVDLAAIVRDSLASAPTGGHGLEVDIEPVVTRGDPVLLRRMVDNLVENAVRHNVDGGRILVGLVRDRAGAHLRVANDGARLTPSEAAELVRPFRRAPATKKPPGFGLGLAIVAAVVARHRGSLRLDAREEGGLAVAVRLPAAEPGSADQL